MSNKQFNKARAQKRLRQQGLEQHVRRVFGNRKPVVFIAGQTIYIDADRKE